MRRAVGLAAILALSVLLMFPALSSSDEGPSDDAESAPTTQIRSLQPAAGPAAPWWGITVDTVDHLDSTIAAIAALPAAPVVRLVFDLDQDPASYTDAVTQLSEHAVVLAQVVDSSDFTSITNDQYLDRFRTYVAIFGNRIPLWEIGNEVNGEWLGDPAAVVKAISGADQIVRAKGLTSVLTLYYNPQCADDATHEMFNWAEQQLTPSFRNSLPYVLLSYYPSQCNNYWPDAATWQRTFSKVSTLFAQAKLGIGEVGISDDSGSVAAKADLANRCYGMRVPNDRYIGGCFWWYFAEDAVPHNGNQFWAALAANMTTDR